ncbi:hypothetical protein [Streptomyces paromomycinus]|uniref:DUF2637 domain-containing protein n=1 Tax=Streptomyces paromomycinus TaxID=92743 RepID=A0A401W9Z5_STREY|nr:hypothetical protein [Streptomyces paromomycinus]GCD46133.1 hypothetical protein GKJPGBOP_05880 [Streptomyces paromomycinus]
MKLLPRNLWRRLTRSLRARRTAPLPSSSARIPWWASLFTDAGRPIVAVLVMVMCAPGEHHLGVLAGWDTRLAWGMASVLAAYAGIAAVVASRRPKGAPGKTSAVVGAWLALGAAMAAQPISHLFVTGHWSAKPHAPAWLVIVVSCVPPLVLGHLLHLAATPVPAPSTSVDTEQETPVDEHADEEPATPAPAAPPAGGAPAPQQPPAAPPPVVYRDPRCAAIRPLYDGGTRPGTAAMRDALEGAGYGRVGDSTIRGVIRAEVEEHEPQLAAYPPALPAAHSA